MRKKFNLFMKATMTLILFGSLLSMSDDKVQATQQEQLLPLNGTINGHLESQEKQVFQVIIPTQGELDMKFSSFGEVTFKLFDSNNELVGHRLTISDGTKIDEELYREYLRPGIYRLEVEEVSLSKRTSDFSVKSIFTEIATQDIEPNNQLNEAQSLVFGKKIRGLISTQDIKDVYSIDINREGEVSVDFTIYTNDDLPAVLTDQTGEIVWEGTIIKNNSVFGKLKKDLFLEAGKYYLTLEDGFYSVGTYDVLVKFKHVFNDEKEPNDDISKASKLSFDDWQKGMLTWKDTDYYQVTIPKKSDVSVNLSSEHNVAKMEWIDSKGNVVFQDKTKMNKQKKSVLMQRHILNKGTYYVRISGDNTGSLYQFQVKSSHLLPSVSLKAMNVKSTHVSGTTEKGATVTMKLGKKTYMKKADTKGHFDWKVQKQKAGTVITVTSQNKYGKTTKQLRVSTK